MNFISLEPSLQQPNLNQKKVYCATKTVLGAFMIVSFLVEFIDYSVWGRGVIGMEKRDY